MTEEVESRLNKLEDEQMSADDMVDGIISTLELGLERKLNRITETIRELQEVVAQIKQAAPFATFHYYPPEV